MHGALATSPTRARFSALASVVIHAIPSTVHFFGPYMGPNLIAFCLKNFFGSNIYSHCNDSSERSFLMIKPDGVQRGLIAEIISSFERKGYKLIAIKMLMPSQQIAEQHYSDLSMKPFYKGLTKFLASGPVVAMVWEGDGVVKGCRKLLGATDPKMSDPGSIRGDFSIQVGKNIIHGSDSVESAENEIGLWFKKDEINQWTSIEESWIY